INPNAVEICDGKDNDCEPLSTENGMISQQTLNGWVDVSAVFSTGSMTPFAITQPTELLICPGQYDLAFSVESELTMNTTFDGVILSSAHHRVFAVSQNSTLDIEGITVDDSKGAIGCEQGNVLVSDGRFYGMYDPIQPLFAFDGCNVTFDVVEIEDNIVSTFNPILEATMSTVSFNQVEVTDNINGQNSTGIFFNQSSLSMIDSTITGQQGGTHRGVLLSDSDLECISTGSGQAGIYDTVVGGADSQSVALLGTSTFSSMGCDFGSMVAAGDDVNAKILAGSKAYGPIQSQDIVCDSTGCSGTLDVQSVNATFMTSPTRFGFTGNVYHVTGNPTLLSIEIPIDASGSCGTELAIWTRSYSSSPWTLRWSEAKNYWFGTSMSFSPSGLMLKDDEEVAIGYGWACDPNVAMSVFETGNGLTGHLEFPGLRLSASGFTGQSLNNITLIENSQLRQLSHTVELWTP
ncbi:MAG: putative metal-binding motif-containing protein, partial [Myxococcota bacterium]|nr:putative metal-binding motif-containing protein [Myxococcota bacterium]